MMIEDARREESGGGTGERLLQSLLIHTVWISFLVWYLKVPDSVLCTDPDEYGTGFISLFPPCPEPRPMALLVGITVALIGWLAGWLIPLRRSIRAEEDPGCLPTAATTFGIPLLVGIVTVFIAGSA
jgi:hypothetical protein